MRLEKIYPSKSKTLVLIQKLQNNLNNKKNFHLASKLKRYINPIESLLSNRKDKLCYSNFTNLQ